MRVVVDDAKKFKYIGMQTLYSGENVATVSPTTTKKKRRAKIGNPELVRQMRSEAMRLAMKKLRETYPEYFTALSNAMKKARELLPESYKRALGDAVKEARKAIPPGAFGDILSSTWAEVKRKYGFT